MDKRPEHSNSIWLSFEQLVKYVRGNLLGSKKQEVEDKISASPLMSDAIEGLREVDNPAKLEKTIEALNRQIQLRSGASAPTLPEIEGTEGKTTTLSSKTIFSIAASFTILMAAGAVWWYTSGNIGKTANSEQSVVTADSEKLMEKEDISSKPFIPDSQASYAWDKRADSTMLDSTVGAGTVDFFKNGNELALVDGDLELNEEVEDDATEDTEQLALYERDEQQLERKKESEPTVEKALKNKEVEETAEEAAKVENEGYFANESVIGNANNTSNQYEYNKANNTPPQVLTDSIAVVKDDAELSAYRYANTYENDDASIYQNGIDYLNKGELALAEGEFIKLTDRKDSEYKDDAWWNLAQIYLKQGDDKQAKKALKKIRSSSKYGTRAKEELDKL